MFCIEVQRVDYDGYPVGQPTKIGPFVSEAEAEDFLGNSSRFNRHYVAKDFFVWKPTLWLGTYAVYIRPLDSGLVSPDEWR